MKKISFNYHSGQNFIKLVSELMFVFLGKCDFTHRLFTQSILFSQMI